jgi:hypothetical protein
LCFMCTKYFHETKQTIPPPPAPPTVIPKSELKLTGEISYIVSSRLESYDDTVTYIILKFSLN